MAIQALEVVGWDQDGQDQVQGVVLVDTVTGLPLPLSIHALPDVETAERFLESLGMADARRMDFGALDFAAHRFVRELRHAVTADHPAVALDDVWGRR